MRKNTYRLSRKHAESGKHVRVFRTVNIKIVQKRTCFREFTYAFSEKTHVLFPTYSYFLICQEAFF